MNLSSIDRSRSLLLLSLLLPAAPLFAAKAVPQRPPITVEVDATRATQGVFHSHLVLPVSPGPLVLTYPKWIPGEHSPTGPVQQLVGLRFTAAGEVLEWRRDTVDMFAFHLTVPAGAREIEADFDYLSPPESFGGGYGEGPNATAHLAVVLWNQQVLVPRGAASDAVTYRPSVLLPAGWGCDSALEGASRSGDRVDFAHVFSDPAINLAELRILPHEYVHSWNGKFRRPRGLATGDYERPMAGELLWIYEGLTRYLGDIVLATRAGIRPPEATREYLAWMTSQLEDARPGRLWRPLGDTATAVQLGVDAPGAGTAMRRPLDYYEEAALIWLEADTMLRERSAGLLSLDDFCRQFFGASSAAAPGRPSVSPYSLDDVVAALDRIAPFDWRGFFAERIDRVREHAPTGGLAAAGWRLTYGAEPNAFMAGRELTRETIDWSFGLGIKTNADGALLEVVQASPAFAAGLVPGGKLVAVDDAKFSPEALRRGMEKAVAGGRPLVLLVERRGEVRTAEVTLVRGAVYPHLEPLAASPDALARILQPRAQP